MELNNKLSNYISRDFEAKAQEENYSENNENYNKQLFHCNPEKDNNSINFNAKGNNISVENYINQTKQYNDYNNNSENKANMQVDSLNEIDIINPDKEEIKSLCVSIFTNFAKFSKEDFQFMLSYQNLIKILRLVNIVGNKYEQSIKNNEIDALLKKANPANKKYTLKQFTNFLVFLSQRLEPEAFTADARLCLAQTVKKHFEPLNSYIEDQITSGIAGDYFQHTIVLKYLNSIQIDSNTIFLLNSVYPGIKSLYCAYFPLEVLHLNEKDKVLKSSLNGLIEFCREFEILNFIASLDKIAAYFNFLVELPQEKVLNNDELSWIFEKGRETGKLFTLGKFAALLVHFAVISFEKNAKYLENLVKRRRTLSEMGINFDNLGTAEKLILLLDRLDSGEGIKSWEKRITKGYNARISLMPTVETVANINPLIQKTLEENFSKANTSKNTAALQNIYSTNYNSNGLPSQKSLSNLYNSNNTFKKNNQKQTSDLQNLKDIFPFINDSQHESVLEKLSSEMESLKHLFEAYSNIGFKTDIYNISLSGFIKFASEAQIIQKVEVNESALSLIKSPKENKRNKLSEDLNYNKNNFNTNNSNNILGKLTKLGDEVQRNKRSRSKSNQKLKQTHKQRSCSFDSEKTQKDKQTFTNNNDSIHGENLHDSNVNQYDNNKNKIPKSELTVIYYYLCGLQNFDTSKKIRNHFDKNSGFNPNFENSLKGPSLDSKNLMKADKDLKPLKMNFSLFLKSLGMLADKIYKDYSQAQALEVFLDNELIVLLKKKNCEENSPKKNYMDFLNTMRRNEIFEIMRIIIPLIYPHYLNYCDKFELIDFELFNQFFRDFGVFPNVVNLMQIKAIFFTLQESIANQLNNSKDKSFDAAYRNEIINNLKINFDFFMDGILLTSVHLKEIEEISDIEKIIQIVEKMAISPGIAKSQLRSGHTFSSQKELKKSIKEIKTKLGIISLHEQKDILKADDCFEEIFH